MNYSNIFVILFICGTAINFLLDHVLEAVDFGFRKKHGKEVPEGYEEYFDSSTLEKTVKYENAKYFFYIPKSIVFLALNLSLVFSSFYVEVFKWSWNLTKNAYLTAILFSLITAIPKDIISIPFDLFREFKIEKKYGFSTMNFKMWLADEIKGLLVSLVISLPLLCLAMAVLIHIKSWWFILSIVIVAFSLGLSFIYPVLLAPIFNKFTPLEEGELKERLEALLEKVGFKASGIFVMDASKRSKHSNAYFTGFGKSKRVVLYDTLIAQLSHEEIEAVLAHELGHYKHHHIIKKMLISIPLTFVSLFVVNLLSRIPALYEGFGFGIVSSLEESSQVLGMQQLLGIFLLSLVFDGFTFITSLISNCASRKDEFQADKFSATLCNSGKPLATALIKLNKENLSECSVPKIYSLFNYNHPPLMDRINAVTKD